MIRFAVFTAACVCLGMACWFLLAKRNAAQESKELVQVAGGRQQVGTDGQILLDVFCRDPTDVSDGISGIPLPHYAPGQPIWLRLQWTNQSSTDLLVPESLEESFVNDGCAAVSLTWFRSDEDDAEIPAMNDPHELSRPFTRRPFLTEYGRSVADRPLASSKRIRLAPRASIARNVCLSCLYDLSHSDRWYSLTNLCFRIERTGDPPLDLHCTEWLFRVTRPESNQHLDSTQASTVD